MIVKVKKYFPIIYLVLLISSFFYVRYALSRKYLDIKTLNNNKEKVVKAKEAEVSLNIYNGSKLLASYPKKMTNQNSVETFLTKLMEDTSFSYEKTEYTYGTEFDMVNNIKAVNGYKWRLFDGTADITNNTKDFYLKKDTIYKLIYSK